MNFDNLAIVLEAIKREDVKLVMYDWINSTGTRFGEYTHLCELKNICGTTACIAGTTAIEFFPNSILIDFFKIKHTIDDDDNDDAIYFDDVAAEILELSGLERTLFFVNKWPEWAQDLATRDGDRAAAIALIEAILEEKSTDVLWKDER